MKGNEIITFDDEVITITEFFYFMLTSFIIPFEVS